MIDHRTKFTWTIGLAACLALTWLAGCSRQPDASVFDGPVTQAGTVEISPDYRRVTIPPNIAPLNFKVISPCPPVCTQGAQRPGQPDRGVQPHGMHEDPHAGLAYPPGGQQRSDALL
jgi:hypothetical protein